jgi:hypothetical protein
MNTSKCGSQEKRPQQLGPLVDAEDEGDDPCLEGTVLPPLHVQHSQCRRSLGNMPDRRHDMIDGHAVKTIPIGTDVADAFVTGGDIRT